MQFCSSVKMGFIGLLYPNRSRVEFLITSSRHYLWYDQIAQELAFFRRVQPAILSKAVFLYCKVIIQHGKDCPWALSVIIRYRQHRPDGG